MAKRDLYPGDFISENIYSFISISRCYITQLTTSHILVIPLHVDLKEFLKYATHWKIYAAQGDNAYSGENLYFITHSQLKPFAFST